MIRRLDHVAVAVRKVDEHLGLYRDLLGLPLERIEEVAGEKVKVAILGQGAGRIELVEPLQEGSSVHRFLEERGEGIHHLCFLVDSLDETCRILDAAGYRLAGGIRAGSEGTRIAFLHPRGTGGVLIELREATEGEA
jgi:methylmalonyl-CoA/ethylmalonyl-CoA epimerase